ncbi:IclR family transcriptional regulator [Brevibacterium epidermidis]|uniref:IclR family transcriptional regulator n=1 Tax=Brevibacterium epidermidis TaxID=1698 RepID=UPI000BF9E91F|nr:IclR family transcriptional regulator [Brevibacterium epidermidis]
MSQRLAGLDRALSVMEVLAQSGDEGIALGRLSAILQLDKASIYRILTTLKARGYASQDDKSGSYRAGPSLLTLADDYLSQDTLRSVLHRVARQASAEANELCHVGVPDGNYVRYVDKIEPELAIRVYSHVGIRNPTWTTALGRALLAVETTSHDDLAQRLDLDPDDLSHVASVVGQARDQGFATENEENEPGISCVAVAVERRGIGQAAVSLTVPSTRMSSERMEELGLRLRAILEEHLPPGLRPQQMTERMNEGQQ